MTETDDDRRRAAAGDEAGAGAGAGPGAGDEPGARRVRLRYFAWLRQRIGTGAEDVTLPARVTTGAELVAWLAGRGPGYARALERPELVKLAFDQQFARPEDRLGAAREIALFPPVTGG